MKINTPKGFLQGLRPGGCNIPIGVNLFDRLVFLFSVLNGNNHAKEYGNNCQRGEKNIKLSFLHFYAPLSAKIPIPNKIKKTAIPIKNNFISKPVLDARGPKISIAATSLQISRNVLETFSLCFFVNLMLNFRTNGRFCQGIVK
ncbi:MAG: hypothetical protein CVU78_06030 [Elusimicrobia bacterium HGW-Elusimicrobia-2]|nr:MAG: hypothetical protein CVU78_06030 [Elusimicrobia bacterium HGW-Elusimicrobia-2]